MTEPGARASELPTLTPLRGIAALIVVLFHAELVLPNLGWTDYTLLFHKGYLGVDLFFLMSGCVLAHVYKAWFAERLSPAALGAFLRARFARIYPLHLAVLAYMVVIQLLRQATYSRGLGSHDAAPFSGRFSLEALVENIFLVQGLWNEAYSWNIPSWSISTEAFAYLAFPLAAFALLRAGPALTLAMIGLLFAALAWLAWDHGGLNISVGPSFLRCIYEFLIGTLLYRLHEQGVLARLLRGDAAFLAAAVAALALMHLGLPDILIVAAFMALVVAGIRNDGRVRRALHIRPLVWLGTVSYSIYMVQAATLDRLNEILAGLDGGAAALGPWLSLAALAAALAFLLLLSHVTYRRIEVPARRALGGRKRTGRAAGPAGVPAR